MKLKIKTETGDWNYETGDEAQPIADSASSGKRKTMMKEVVVFELHDEDREFPYVTFGEHNDVRYYQDFRFNNIGLPSGVKFYCTGQMNGQLDFFADGYGAGFNTGTKYGISGEYGSGMISINESYDAMLTAWCLEHFLQPIKAEDGSHLNAPTNKIKTFKL